MSKIEHSLDKRGLYFGIVFFIIIFLVAGSSVLGSQYFAHRTDNSQTASASLAEVVTTSEAVSDLDTSAPLVSPAASLRVDTPTSGRVIRALTVEDVVAQHGNGQKLIIADLSAMKVFLYEHGSTVAEFPIITKGREGTPWETPAGLYSVKTKEESHFSTIGHVYMPYSMQIFGNYFIHGLTHYPDGTPVSASFSGGCIKLSTEDAHRVFEFSDIGTKVFVYEQTREPKSMPLPLSSLPAPAVTASSYVLADIDSGDVYLERNAQAAQPALSATSLMTALVANEIIHFDKKLSINTGYLEVPTQMLGDTPRAFAVGDLLYPLIMQSNTAVAETLSTFYGNKGFLRWMNAVAHALNMQDSLYASTDNKSTQNLSTADDLFRLTAYLANKKSFVLDILSKPEKTITSEEGEVVRIINQVTATSSSFAGNTLTTVLSVPVNDTRHRVAAVVMGSTNPQEDARRLALWLEQAVEAGEQNMAACASCANNIKTRFRKIDLEF